MAVLTVSEAAGRWKVDRPVADGVLKFLLSRGLVKEGGTRPAERGFGKPSKLYEVPDTVTLDLTAGAASGPVSEGSVLMELRNSLLVP